MADISLQPARPHASADSLAILVLVLGAITIGFAAPLVRLSETGPIAAAFWRLTFATPILYALTLSVRGVPHPAKGLRLSLLAGLLFAGDLAFWHSGIALTSVANATVLSNLSPIVVALMAWALLGDRPRPLFALGLFIGLAGAVGMALFANHAARPASLLGDALSAGTALWYGLYLLTVNTARRSMPAATIMFISSAAGAPIMLALALAFGEPIIPAGGAGWAACVALGLVHVVGQGSIAWALGRVSAPLTSVILLVQPVVAAVIGVLLFNETPTALQAAAGVLALVGIWIARLAAAPRAIEPAA